MKYFRNHFLLVQQVLVVYLANLLWNETYHHFIKSISVKPVCVTQLFFFNSSNVLLHVTWESICWSNIYSEHLTKDSGIVTQSVRFISENHSSVTTTISLQNNLSFILPSSIYFPIFFHQSSDLTNNLLKIVTKSKPIFWD